MFNSKSKKNTWQSCIPPLLLFLRQQTALYSVHVRRRGNDNNVVDPLITLYETIAVLCSLLVLN